MTVLFVYPKGKRSESVQVWPEASSLPAGFVQETCTYLFELSKIDDVFSAEMFIDDVPLEALRPLDQSTALWQWTPGFHAGSVEASFSYDKRGMHRFELVTDPDLRKLSRDQFDTMVQEILEDTFALFTLSSFKTGIARGSAGPVPPIARLEFLYSRLEQLSDVIKSINSNPRRVLKRQEITQPYYKASRATGPEIIKSFRSGNIRRETGKSSRLPPNLKGCLPAQITRSVTHSALDIREHREIKACLKNWACWLKNISDLLRKAARNKGNEDQESQQMSSVWARRTNGMSRSLYEMLGLPLFQEIPDTPGKPELSSIYRNVPTYRKFFQIYRDFNLGLANIFGDFLQMPLARTFDLYELWCFLRLLRVAQQNLGVQPDELNKLFSYIPGSGNVTIETEAVSIPLGNGVALSFQRRFKEYWIENNGTGSFSRHMIPDITFITPAANEDGQLIVLDAKYRIDNNLNAALASIHMYRDALVSSDDQEGLSGAVRAAYLLSPHIPESSDADWKRTSMPGRLFHPDYRDTFRFGAATLKPGMSLTEIWQTLQTILKDAQAA